MLAPHSHISINIRSDRLLKLNRNRRHHLHHQNNRINMRLIVQQPLRVPNSRHHQHVHKLFRPKPTLRPNRPNRDHRMKTQPTRPSNIQPVIPQRRWLLTHPHRNRMNRSILLPFIVLYMLLLRTLLNLPMHTTRPTAKNQPTKRSK